MRNGSCFVFIGQPRILYLQKQLNDFVHFIYIMEIELSFISMLISNFVINAIRIENGELNLFHR